MNSKIIGKPFGRRAVLAGGAAALSMPFIIRGALADAKPFRISLPGNEEEWQAKNLQQFKKSLDASAPGEFDVQIHYNGTLFGQGTEIEAMQRGNLEVGMVSPQDISALIPEYSVFATGYLMRDPAHLDAVYDGDIGAEYKAKIEKDIGITIVKSQYLGTRHVILREAKEVNKPEDLAGLKLRMPGSEAWQFLGNSLGANATPLAFEEVYLAMQTGTIDGLENPLPDAMAAKFYEVSKQIVMTSHMVSNTFFAVASDYWHGLTDAQRAAITAAETDGKKVNDDGVVATEKDAVAFMEGKGLKVVTPDVPAFREKVLNAFVNSDFAKDWPAGMLDRIKAA